MPHQTNDFFKLNFFFSKRQFFLNVLFLNFLICTIGGGKNEKLAALCKVQIFVMPPTTSKFRNCIFRQDLFQDTHCKRNDLILGKMSSKLQKNSQVDSTNSKKAYRQILNLQLAYL